MQLESRKYLYDIQRATCLLREFTIGTTPNADEGHAMLRSAVEFICRLGDARLWSPRWIG